MSGMNRPIWTSAAIAAATGGRASVPFEVTGIEIDSRDVGPGSLFVALGGTKTDGHNFLEVAAMRGAAGALVSRPAPLPHVRVVDTTEALLRLAHAARARARASVVGVTGSVGKTGTKEALAAALARVPGMRVHRSIKSFNNHVGVPLSLARMPADSDFAVFEMGMNHAGELAALAPLVRPHVAIVTAIAPAHIAHFADEDAIADAKAEIFDGLVQGGTALVPHDSPHRDRLVAHARAAGARTWTFGRGEGADIRARDIVRLEQGGTLVAAQLPGAELSFTVSTPGDHWVSNALAVIGAVHALGADLAAAGLALAELPGLDGRGARHRLPVGDGEALLIDESYNANLASMRATVAQLGHEPARRRIVILGEMRELGGRSDEIHAALAPDLIEAGIDMAILVGAGTVPLGEALAGRLAVQQVADAAAARDLIETMLAPGDAVLVKGSNAVGLSRLVAALRAGG